MIPATCAGHPAGHGLFALLASAPRLARGYDSAQPRRYADSPRAAKIGNVSFRSDLRAGGLRQAYRLADIVRVIDAYEQYRRDRQGYMPRERCQNEGPNGSPRPY